ncbi:hypothetical protein BDV39DRAFT_168760 [Aspergillus sergii]|uniref:Uncharacterized protein n=1 Tax=Aspergillus sergii TaxID=1034303 RepID=A0A5N6XIN7_9EURO|nr:hypothetical protein BDV39DRAFT_168760 [Aspergillus sergii]
MGFFWQQSIRTCCGGVAAMILRRRLSDSLQYWAWRRHVGGIDGSISASALLNSCGAGFVGN